MTTDVVRVAYRLLRPFLFLLAPETAHRLAFACLRPVQALLQRRAPNLRDGDPALASSLFGLSFPNPVGLAAGFDKDAELPHVWAALGFGFAELGTVTALPQPGNPPPRLFRLTDDRALINRLGFNNAGAEAVSRDLARRLGRSRPAIPLGANLGKSRAAPLAEATADYRSSLRALFPVADYFTVNVSSPNTPGLRSLQSADRLAPLLRELAEENARLAGARGVRPRPILVKLAPDLEEADLRATVDAARHGGAAGVIATNTTLQRPGLRGACAADEAGGLSGAPLREISTSIIRALHRYAPDLPIIGAGGVFSADDAYEKVRAGAALVQVYTGFVYEGPTLPRDVCAGLRRRLERDGFPSLAAAVGADERNGENTKGGKHESGTRKVHCGKSSDP